MIEENNEINGKDAEPIIINKDNIGELLTESGIPEHISSKIEECYNDEFIDAPPIAENLIDKKALDKNEQRKKEERLEKKVQILEEKLETTKKELEANNDTDIIVKVRPEKVSEIKSQIIDGKKYIIIPIEENEQANVNGIASLL
jgi:citrate synthase